MSHSLCVCDGVAPPPGGHLTRMKCTCVPACGPSGLRMGSCGRQGRSGKLFGRHAWVQGVGVTMYECRGRGHHAWVQGVGVTMYECRGRGHHAWVHKVGQRCNRWWDSLTLNRVLHHSHPITSWQWLVKGVHHRSAVPIGSPYGGGWD